MNKRELRQAFVKAMDKIKKQPHRYYFMQAEVPMREHGECRGCVLAWVAFYAGQQRGASFDAVPLLTQLTEKERKNYFIDDVFYTRMSKLMRGSHAWQSHADKAVKALDRYIKKYLAPKKRAA